MYVGSVICTESLRMYVGYTTSFSVRFFALLNSYVCRLNKIFIVCLFCPCLFCLRAARMARFFRQNGLSKPLLLSLFLSQNCFYHTYQFCTKTLTTGFVPKLGPRYQYRNNCTQQRVHQNNIVCTTLFVVNLEVLCSYLEYNVITPFCSHVLYQFLHTYFFYCMEVLCMQDL